MNNDHPNKLFTSSNIWMIIGVIIGFSAIIIPSYYFIIIPMQSDYNQHLDNMMNYAQSKDPTCINLRLDTAVAGNGLWGFSEKESKLHQLAQERLDKGDCVK